MFEILVEGRGICDLVHLAVDLYPLEATFLESGELLAVFTLAAAHDGGEQIKTGAFFHTEGPVDHLADRLGFDRQSGGRGVGDTNPGVEQAQVIVNLSNRAHG